MTTTGRSADSRRVRRGPAQWLLGLLLALAIGASIAMMFSNSRSIAASLAVISALWAAVIGAILVTKFRRQADSAESKARDLRLVYELQLEREITARRQYELGVETQVRREVHAETNEELAELKAQIEALRASLELLVGGDLPEQRAALRSERRRELDRAQSRSDESYSSSGSFSPSDPAFDDAAYDDGAVAERDFASTAPEVGADQVPIAEPNTLTEVIPVVTDDGQGPTSDDDGLRGAPRPAPSSRHGAAAADPGPADVPAFVDETPTDEWAVAPAEVVAEPIVPDPVVADPIAASDPIVADIVTETPTPPVSSHASQGGGRHGRGAASAQPTPSAAPVDEPAATPTPSRSDRHRAPDPEPGAHQAGRSVSELIDQLRSGTGGGGRRRRQD
ncbi:DUF6779 domain-containing protein [Williamsia sp.]|uniref:DUF6779 domain-containing protein n=1 Tax=Williamsia sp. TaxID=1872085 RepID=UPI001A27C4FA|nr:DUF6779 domain-containing protein [Williamsia sp.]MBJ7287627.1 hypothetical protein [Williamsia sp.]